MNTTGFEDLDIADAQECGECRQFRLDRSDPAPFVLTPAHAGGWQSWAAALLRLLVRIGDQPTRAVVITQELATRRYVQALIGHGIALPQASSNVYLEGASALTADEMMLLATLGWSPPRSDHDDPGEMPANWSLPYIHGDWAYVVEMFLATLVGVLGFDEHLPVQVRTFGCHDRCRECSWPEAVLAASPVVGP